jgi:hypothetical protein
VKTTEIDYPIEATIEMAIASFLDTEALSFVDCKPGRGQSKRGDRLFVKHQKIFVLFI